MKKCQAGFTLIETIITLIVLSIAAIGVLSVFTFGIGRSADPLIVGQATQMAQGELDTVIGIKTANGFSSPDLNTGTGQACKTAMLTGFNCSLDICFVTDVSLDNTGTCNTPTLYKRVAVTVTNPTGGSVELVTLLTSY
ncbi:MAG: type II secretion system protein [Nitrospirota bacterium]